MIRAQTSTGRQFFAGVSPSFLDVMTEGMHTLAQPLTVLRATLEIASGNALSVSHYQHAIDTSLNEIERVAQAMGYVQELVRIARDASLPAITEIVAVMDLVRQDLECVFAASGVRLNVDLTAGLPRVQISAPRLRQCLFHLLQHCIRECGNGGSIDAFGGATKSEVRLVLRATPVGTDVCHVATTEGIIPCLALAESLAQLNGGHLEWQPAPFTAWLCLPVSDEWSKGQTCADTEPSSLSNQIDACEESA